MPKPLTPNFVPGVGRLATDRFDFQAHVNGTGFRHNATMIDLTPNLDGYTTVQEALNAVFTDFPPVIPSATPSVLGLITLGGDLNGTGSTALSPKVSGLQGRPVQNLAPSTGQILTWNGSLWGPANNNAAVTFSHDLTGNNAAQTVVQVTGDVAGTLNIASANTTNTVNIGNGAFVGSIVIGDNPGGPSIQLGNGSSGVIIPNVAGSNAMVIGGVTGQLSPAPGVTYTFTGTTSLNVTAPLKTTSSLTVGFTNVTAFPYTVDSGATPDYLLLVQDAVTRTITLPTVTAGRVIKIKDGFGSATIHNITINTVGGAAIDNGAGTTSITKANGMLELTSDGTDWFTTGSYQYP